MTRFVKLSTVLGQPPRPTPANPPSAEAPRERPEGKAPPPSPDQRRWVG